MHCLYVQVNYFLTGENGDLVIAKVFNVHSYVSHLPCADIEFRALNGMVEIQKC